MSVTGLKYDRNAGVRKVTLTTNPALNPLSNSNTASQNYYCLGLDVNGFQYQIDLQALPAGVDISQIQQNEVWWVEKRTTLYRLYLYAGMYDPTTQQINSTAPLPAATSTALNNVTINGGLTLTASGITASGNSTFGNVTITGILNYPGSTGNYLPISGGTITGNLTVASGFTVSGTISTQSDSSFATFDQSILNLMGAWG